MSVASFRMDSPSFRLVAFFAWGEIAIPGP